MAIDIQSIYEDIRERITNLTIYPNTQMKEEVLASTYNISRTPIRGVISRLVQEKLLVVVPKKGTYVSRIQISAVNNELYVRLAVESKIFEELIDKITKEDIKELNDILDEQENITKLEPSIQKSQLFHKSDNKFHETLFRIAGHKNLWKELDLFNANFNRVRLITTLKNSWNLNEVYKKHRIIVDYLSAKNTKDAIKELDEHLNLARNGIKVVVNEFASYFVQEEAE